METPKNDVHLYLQKVHGLTIEECKAFCNYIYQDGRDINPKILRNELTPELSCLIENLESAIKKLTKAATGLVYRNDRFTDNQLRRALAFFEKNKNETVLFTTFLSTTKREYFTQNASDYNWVMEIGTSIQSNAIDVSKIRSELGQQDSEQEVLFNKGSFFTVLKVNSGGRIKVVLKESKSNISAIEVPYFKL